MFIRLSVFTGTTANVMDAEAVDSTLQAVSKTAASGPSSWAMEPLSIVLWIVALIAVGALWYAMSEKPYAREIYRRAPGVGPLTHFRNVLMNRISSFLP